MKKIIIEQIGNIIMIVLLAAMLIESLTSPKTTLTSEGFALEFGQFAYLFIAWLVIFGIIKLLASKILKKDGYQFNSGEFSVRDEREMLLTQKSVIFSYKLLVTLNLVTLPLMYITQAIFPEEQLTRTLPIYCVAGSIIVAFTGYLLHWIVGDLKA